MWRFISFLFIVLTLTVVLASAQTNCPDNLPRYPGFARQARIQGVVQVEFDIAKDGTVINASSQVWAPHSREGSSGYCQHLEVWNAPERDT